MINKLQPIILQKQREVAALKSRPELVIEEIQFASIKNFKQALCCSSIAVIAEIKRKSPSKGVLASISNPTALAELYVSGGANALSVLTDELFFGGHANDLRQVANRLRAQPQPILRKDFIIDEIQIAEAIAMGADAILLIVAVLKEKTKVMLDYAKKMGVHALVEVHDNHELEIALASGAEIIGVNNRDLTTLQVDTQRAFKLLEYIPKDIVKVAESGILTPELAGEYYRAGFNAVLIGEALVKSADPTDFIQRCRDV